MSLTSILLSARNINHNVDFFRKLIGTGKLCAVVKANAYGHGLQEIVSIVNDKIDFFQVDDIEELIAIRRWTNKPVFVFGYVENEDLEKTIDLDGIPGIYDEEQLAIIDAVGGKLNRKLPVHIEVDALLGRLGLLAAEVPDFLNRLNDYPFIECQYIFSHFSNIEDSNDLCEARQQYSLLAGVTNKFPYHIAATSGILTDPETNWGGAMARLGVGLYGLWPSENLRKQWAGKMELKPALRWVTKVAQVKMLPPGYPIGYGQTFRTVQETKIAIIPQGYSDGYDRKLSNNADVLIGGKRCTILGRIAMNMFTVDVSAVPGVTKSDEEVLLGEQGEEEITAEELAGKVGTINYEIVARISSLLPRTIITDEGISKNF